LTNLLPLLPLLQAVPLHIDAAKNDLKDIVRNTALACDNNLSAGLLAQKRKSPHLDASPRLSTLKRARLGFDHVNKQLPSPSRSRGAEENLPSSANPSSVSRIRTPGPAGLRISTPPMMASLQKHPPGSSKTGSGSHSRQLQRKMPRHQYSARLPAHDTTSGGATTSLSSSLQFNNEISAHSLSVDEHQLGALSISNKNAHQSTSLSIVSCPASGRQQSPKNVPITVGIPTGLMPSPSLRVCSDAPNSHAQHLSQLHPVLDRSVISDLSVSSRPQSVKDFSVVSVRSSLQVVHLIIVWTSRNMEGGLSR
jgi:hypothetical protein